MISYRFSAVQIVLLFVVVLNPCLLVAQTGSSDPHGDQSAVLFAKTMGVVRGDCKKCHPSEVSSWMKTTHFQSATLRLSTFTGNTKKYADALGIKENELLTTSLCADCHGTKSMKENQMTVVSGVSCEKCHGAAGGEDGWLNRHQSYHNTKVIPRLEESPEHRTDRIAKIEEAGMIRSENVQGLANACYNCHIVKNEKLVAAGHKLASAFEFVSWSEGEVKHNFLMNKNHNADAPTLWQETAKSSPQDRRRIKFVLGAFAQLENGLRARAAATNPIIIPQLGGMVAAANGKMLQLNGVAPATEFTDVSNLITPMMATLFAPLPTDSKTYQEAADKVAAIAKKFDKQHDGSQLPGIDALLSTLQPHYSQQFKEKYLRK